MINLSSTNWPINILYNTYKSRKLYLPYFIARCTITIIQWTVTASKNDLNATIDFKISKRIKHTHLATNSSGTHCVDGVLIRIASTRGRTVLERRKKCNSRANWKKNNRKHDLKNVFRRRVRFGIGMITARAPNSRRTISRDHIRHRK